MDARITFETSSLVMCVVMYDEKLRGIGWGAQLEERCCAVHVLRLCMTCEVARICRFDREEFKKGPTMSQSSITAFITTSFRENPRYQ